MHDKGEKIVLGVKIPAGGGKEDGEKVLDILARHPSTARFISTKLAQRFVADDPPPELIDRMAKTFLEKNGDIRAVMETMLTSKEFFSQGAYRAKVKTPFEMIVSAVRATGAEVDFAFPLANQIAQLGEPLYRKLEPTGYSNVNAEWMNSASLLARMNFALALAQNHVPGIKVDPTAFSNDPAQAAQQVLFHAPSPDSEAAMEKAWPPCRPIPRRITILPTRLFRPGLCGPEWLRDWCSGRPIFRGGRAELRLTVGGFYDGVSSKDAANISARYGHRHVRTGYCSGLARPGERGRSIRRAQESAGGDFPARRRGRPERGGAVRRKHYYDLRPTIAIPAPKVGIGGPGKDAAIDLDGFFGLHPALAPLKPIYDGSHLAIVHAVGSPDPTRSHFDAQDYMESGTPGRKATSDGWLNRALPRETEEALSPVRAVSLGPQLPRALRGTNEAVAVNNLNEFKVRDPLGSSLYEACTILLPIPILNGTGRETFEAVKMMQAIQKQPYTPANGAKYPNGGWAIAEQIARLIKADVGLEVAFTDVGGWDTHVNEVGATPVQGNWRTCWQTSARRSRRFIRIWVTAWQTSTVVTMSEFGRTAHENGNRGTDHGHANT